MSAIARWFGLCVVLVLVMACPAMDQDGNAAAAASADSSFVLPLSSVGAGLAVIGGAMGIGRIGASAVESMARQPELAGNIQTAMIIAAAFIEGATLFAIVVCTFR